MLVFWVRVLFGIKDLCPKFWRNYCLHEDKEVLVTHDIMTQKTIV